MTLPEKKYSPDSPLTHPGEFLSELWRDLLVSRGLAWSLTVRDFKALYRQSYAGYLWAVLPPLFASLTFILLQADQVVSFGNTGIPYPAFVLIGTILWQVFVDSLNNPMRVMQASRQMLTKINFPREALVLSAIQMSLINLLIRLLILVPALVWFRFPLHTSILLAPVGMLVLVLLGTTMGLFLATVGMLYQDIGKGVLLLTNLWMFLTPVVFSGVRSGAMGLIMRLNPVTHILTTTRDWLTDTPPAFLPGFFVVTVLTFIGLVLAWLMYRLFLPRVIERLGM